MPESVPQPSRLHPVAYAAAAGSFALLPSWPISAGLESTLRPEAYQEHKAVKDGITQYEQARDFFEQDIARAEAGQPTKTGYDVAKLERAQESAAVVLKGLHEKQEPLETAHDIYTVGFMAASVLLAAGAGLVKRAYDNRKVRLWREKHGEAEA